MDSALLAATVLRGSKWNGEVFQVAWDFYAGIRKVSQILQCITDYNKNHSKGRSSFHVKNTSKTVIY